VVLDHVQFIKRGWQHRDKIKTKEGSIWLSVPIKNKGNYKQALKDTEIDYSQDWIRKHLNTLAFNYQKAAYWKEFFPEIKKIYEKKHPCLIDLSLDFINYFLKIMEISIDICHSSELKAQGTKSELLLDLCRKCSASQYITGMGSKNYLDEDLFKKENIEVVFKAFEEKEYSQQFDTEFIPFLSAIDALFNCGLKIKDYLL
jgi:hypothetical protein